MGKHKHDPTVTVVGSSDQNPIAGICVYTAAGDYVGTTNAAGQVGVPSGTSIVVNPTDQTCHNGSWSTPPVQRIVADVSIPLDPI